MLCRTAPPQGSTAAPIRHGGALPSDGGKTPSGFVFKRQGVALAAAEAAAVVAVAVGTYP